MTDFSNFIWRKYFTSILLSSDGQFSYIKNKKDILFGTNIKGDFVITFGMISFFSEWKSH